MEKNNIVRQFTKFIYPFKYKNNDPSRRLDETQLSSKGSVMRLWERCGIDGSDLREGISEFFSDMEGECSARIADCYKINANCRTVLNLPKKPSDILQFSHRNRKESFSVAITDARLYMFESEVGFAEFTCEYKSTDFSDYVECNYFISEIKSESSRFSFTKRAADLSEAEITFTPNELFQKIISYVGEAGYFDGVGTAFSIKKPIIYSHILFDSRPQDIENVLFLARKNYKDSYKLPQSEYIINENPYIFQSFENSYWATSLNGATNISFLTGDKKTDEFFFTNFPSKLSASYYHLFLSVLHQKYLMRHLSAKMGCLDKIEKNYSVMNAQLKTGREYQQQAASLKFRAFFKNPSNVEHINKYYNLISNTYEIDLTFKSFNEDLNSIVSICDSYVTRIKQRDDKKQKLRKEKIEVFVSVFGSLVAFATLFNSSWAILEKAFGKTLSFLTPQVLIVLGALLVPIFTIFFNVRGRLIEIRYLTKSLNDEIKEGLVEDDGERKARSKKKKRVKRAK